MSFFCLTGTKGICHLSGSAPLIHHSLSRAICARVFSLYDSLEPRLRDGESHSIFLVLIMKTNEIAKTIYSSVSLALLVFSIGIVAEDYAMTTFSKRQSRLQRVQSFVIEKKERCHTLAADLDFFDYMFFMALFVLQEIIKNVAYDYLKVVVNKVRSWCARDPPPPVADGLPPRAHHRRHRPHVVHATMSDPEGAECTTGTAPRPSATLVADA